MEIQELKNYILENHKVEDVLLALGCHHVAHRNGSPHSYYTCGNPDGDNPNAITVYENTYLRTINYTRNIEQNAIPADIISLVQHFCKCSFFHAVKQICDWVGLSYYHNFDQDLPESLRLTKLLRQLSGGEEDSPDNTPLRPIPEALLRYYHPWVNDMFYADHISYTTQRTFEVGYDSQSNRITIPIRDEMGTLVGVKGRLFAHAVPEGEVKYTYLERVNRSRILYGLHLTYPYIKRAGKVYVGESEKSVMQLWDMGVCNAVATGGKKVSSCQIEMLTRLCADVVFLFDQDVKKPELQFLADKFVSGVPVYALLDNTGILGEKESPTDSPEKFRRLVQSGIVKLK